MKPNTAFNILSVLLLISGALLFKSCCEDTNEYFNLPEDELILFSNGDTVIYTSNNCLKADTFIIKVKLYYETNSQECDFCYCMEHYQVQWVRYYELADSLEEIGSLRHHYDKIIQDIFRFKGFVVNEGVLLPVYKINDMTFDSVTVYSNPDSITVDSMIIQKFWHNYPYGIISYKYQNGDIYNINF